MKISKFALAAFAAWGACSAQAQLPPCYSASPNGYGLTDAASYVSEIAPGSLAVAWGDLPVATLLRASGYPLPTSLGGVSFVFHGPDGPVAAPLLYVAPGQAAFELPWNLSSLSNLRMLKDGQMVANSACWGWVNQDIAPGLFSVNGQGTGQGAILDARYQLVDAAHPALPGDVIQIYASGLGAVDHTPPLGTPASADPLSRTLVTPWVMIGALPAKVLFSGLAPDLVGVYQINVEIPRGIWYGAQTVSINVNGRYSNGVTIEIAPYPGAGNW